MTEVIQHAPGEYRLVERIGFQLFIKFWDVEAFTHYVTWTRGQDEGAEGQQKGADMVVWLKSVYPRAFYLLGFLMIRTGQFERAIGFLDRGLSPADLLIVTNDTSRATISVGGREVKLGPMSYLRVRPSGRSWWARHGLAHGGDARRWIGQIWAKIRGPENDDPPGGANMVIGVRG